MKRKVFLKEFLGALGAVYLTYSDESESQISGTVVYDPNDPEETQNFCWHITEEQAPRDEVYRLAKMLNEDNILKIDKIPLTREHLLKRYNEINNVRIDQTVFNKILEELEEIRVNMVDDGMETDAYFIHE